METVVLDAAGSSMSLYLGEKVVPAIDRRGPAVASALLLLPCVDAGRPAATDDRASVLFRLLCVNAYYCF